MNLQSDYADSVNCNLLIFESQLNIETVHGITPLEQGNLQIAKRTCLCESKVS